MKKNTKSLRLKRSFVIATAILVLIFAMACISYAATGGQVFNDIKLWINGQQVDASSYVDGNGHYIVKMQGKTDVVMSDEDSEIKAENNGGEDAVLDVYQEGTDSEAEAAAEVIIGKAD